MDKATKHEILSGNGLTNRALVVFAKEPLPGTVKTRLSPPLTPVDAAELYRCMLADTVAACSGLAGTTLVLCVAPTPGAATYFHREFPGVPVMLQEGADLGARLSNAFKVLFSLGFRTVAAIGTDAPDLPPEFVTAAFCLLESATADVVFGPAADGGYYLVALQTLHARLFQDIPWSTAETLTDSEAAAGELGLRSRHLPLWHDLDTAADLQRLLAGNVGSPASHTRRMVQTVLKGETPESP